MKGYLFVIMNFMIFFDKKMEKKYFLVRFNF